MARETPKHKLAARRKATSKTRKKSSPRQPVAIAYEARGTWGDEEVSELLGLSDIAIGRAVFRKNVIAFDWLTDEREPSFHTRLSTHDGVHYEGYTDYVPGCGDDRARIKAVLYSNSLGHILLGRGTWEQEGRIESFVVQFHSGKPLDGE